MDFRADSRGAPMCAVSILCAVLILASAAPAARADVVTDWNAKAADIVYAATFARLPAPAMIRAMAIVQVSVFDAVAAVSGRFTPLRGAIDPAPGTSLEAAVAAANRAVLLALVPSQQGGIDAAYQAAMAAVPEGPGKASGVEAGEKAAAAVLSWSADDGSAVPAAYRPRTSPGVYVPTVLPAVPGWGSRRPWLMTRGDQFRPGPPPSLSSSAWTKDYNEIKALGGKTSSQRTPEQTDIARFWEATGSAMYWPIFRSVAANQPGREVTDNALLLAAAGMALDDAIIAVWDAKYTYNFWRPVTAIRNGDTYGNAATARDASWTSFIDTPMHPEYPCAHCVAAGAAAAVLEAVVGTGPDPWLTSPSPTAPGMIRHWATPKDLVDEVMMARIYDGVHYRNSTVVGAALGRKVGQLAAAWFLKTAQAAPPARLAAMEERPPLDVGETKVTIGNGIVGIINRPAGNAKMPAVLLLHSFASQKNENGDLFKRLAAALSAKGIASFRFDYPGWGESKGDIADSTIGGWIDNAAAGHGFLVKQSFVDPARLGVLGFSVSGGIAIMTASQNPGWFTSMVTWSSVGSFKEMLGLLGQDNMDKAAREGKVDIDLHWTKLTLKDAFFRSLFAYDVAGSLKSYPGALLAIAGSKDFSAAYVQPFVNSVTGNPRKAEIVPDGDHMFGVFGNDQSMSTSVIKDTAEWFGNTL
ncbi:MAG TPA: phosphatase PAP2 family protein [Spirochaetia bacterium]|nr:phosphatase PAP2 family protein [Spirochaetia bacterium]